MNAPTFPCLHDKKKSAFLIMTKQCIEIIEYDLKNQYAVISDTMIKFHLGIPMGKSASPPIANILAIFQM